MSAPPANTSSQPEASAPRVSTSSSATVSVENLPNEKQQANKESIYTTPDPNNPYAPAPEGKPYPPDYVPLSAEALVPIPRLPKGTPAPPPHRASYWIQFLLWYNMYRKLFTIVVVTNLVLIILRWTGHSYTYGRAYPGAQVLGNFMVTVLVRNEIFGRILYWLANTFLAKNRSPMFIKYTATNVLQHLGGIHTGTAVSGLAWLMTYVIDIYDHKKYYHRSLLATGTVNLVLVWVTMIAAFPWVRNTHHNVFERWHRFAGWLTVAFTWVFALLWDFWDKRSHHYIHTGGRAFFSQTFWYSLLITIFVALPWFFIRNVEVKVELPSPKVAVLRFNRGMQQGLLARISRTPIWEYHAFGTISEGKKSGCHYLICGVQGDFTKGLVNDMPNRIWTRELKVAGVSNTTTLYRRGVRVCTGTGLGAALSSCLQSPNWFLIWIGSDMEKTFGNSIQSLIVDNLGPERRLLWDSKARKGRPNIMKILEEVYHGWGAEVIFITSNYTGNQEIMEGCKERGMHCFGTLWDF